MIPSMWGIVMVFVAVSLVAPSQAGCPTGWVKQGFKCTRLFSEPSTWKEAEQSCQSFTNEAGQAGNLLSIADVKENALLGLWGMISEQVDNLWIGLRRQNDDDVMTWSDGLPTDFYGLVMDGLLDLSEVGDCALAKIADLQSTLMSANCNKKLQYVCELSACPAGWTSYFGNCYRYFDEKKSWIEAEGRCHGYQGGDFVGQLVSVATEDFSRFLTEWQMMLTSDSDSAGKTWVGLDRDRLRETNGKMAGCSQIEGGVVVSNVNCSTASAYVCEISTCPMGLVAFQDQCVMYVGDEQIGGDKEGAALAVMGGHKQTSQRSSKRSRRAFNFWGTKTKQKMPPKKPPQNNLFGRFFASKKKAFTKSATSTKQYTFNSKYKSRPNGFTFWNRPTSPQKTTSLRSFGHSSTTNKFTKFAGFGARFKPTTSVLPAGTSSVKEAKFARQKSIPITPTTAPKVQPKCPAGWIGIVGSCFLYSRDIETTWEAAESDCTSKPLGLDFKGYEAHLPTIDNGLQMFQMVYVVQNDTDANLPSAWIGRKVGIQNEGNNCDYVNVGKMKATRGSKSCSATLPYFCMVKKTDKYKSSPVGMSSMPIGKIPRKSRPVPKTSSSSTSPSSSSSVVISSSSSYSSSSSTPSSPSANNLQKYCFPTWKRRGDFCYYVFMEERAWGAARDQCKEYIYGNEVNEKASLVSVTSSEENNFLVNESSSMLPFWIGIDDTKWLDGTDVSYRASSVTNHGGRTNLADDPGSCSYSLNKQWGQKKCSQKLPFICKMAAAAVAHFVRKK